MVICPECGLPMMSFASKGGWHCSGSCKYRVELLGGVVYKMPTYSPVHKDISQRNSGYYDEK